MEIIPPQNQKSIKTANSSGFPLQIAAAHVLNQSRDWRVFLEEHPWRSDITDSEGFIDIVAVKRDDIWVADKSVAMVLECKRVLQTEWVFLIPSMDAEERRQMIVWNSNLNDSNCDHYGWCNLPAYPPSYQSQYCAIPGQEQGRRNILERTASQLIDSVEALAKQEWLVIEQQKIPNFARVYIPVLLTTAHLSVSSVDPATISLSDGCLPAETPVTSIPYIRFKKSLSPHIGSSPPNSLENLHMESERTIMVVNAERFSELLSQFELV